MKTPDKATCYKAQQSTDARFDGLIFVGVKSTRIYFTGFAGGLDANRIC